MIDRYDAPEGMVALRMWEDCGECHYFKDVKDTEDDGYCPHFQRCNYANRKDGESACFVTREEFEKMLIKEIRGFYQAKSVSLSRDNDNICIELDDDCLEDYYDE